MQRARESHRTNKKAHHDYTIVDTLEAGMVLTGTEIVVARAARIISWTAFAQVKMGSLAEQCSYRLTKRVISGTRSQNAVVNSSIRSKFKNWK